MMDNVFFINENLFENSFERDGDNEFQQYFMENIKQEKKGEDHQNKGINGIKTEFISNLNQNNISNENHTNILKEINIQKKKNNLCKKKLGRKKKNSKEKGEHTKYSEDNILRKIKSTIISYLHNCLNSNIYNIYSGKIGKGRLIKQLKKMNQSQILNSTGNKIFLYKNLETIFSEDISNKFSNYSYDHNKNVIKGLLREEDEEKRVKFERLFSLTFLDCLMHFRGSKYIPELELLGTLDDITAEKFGDDQEYLDLFKYYIYNYEQIIMNKKNRKHRKY